MARRAVFLDRDGVVNALVPDPVSGHPESPLDPAHVQILPGVTEAICHLRDRNYLVFAVTNQPAAAKGLTSEQALLEVQRAVLARLDRSGAQVDDWRLCLHHPEGTVASLTKVCVCRKPSDGMLRDLADKWGVDLGASWVVGDSDVDIAAGRSAGCRTVLVEHRQSAHRRGDGDSADFKSADCAGAVELILHAGGSALV